MKSKNSAGVLVQSVNHATGENTWKVRLYIMYLYGNAKCSQKMCLIGTFFIQVMPEDYDYNQELARAAFADMLHDSERNQLYRY